MELHNRLKQARLDKKLSQQELEKISKVHYTNIGRYERGEAKPSAEVLKRLAEALDISTDFLFNGTLNNKATKDIIDEKILSRFKKIEALPENKKLLLLEFLDGFIFKSNIQQQMT
jgi:transcriptional regulator with XRE-family HTH domain